MVVLEQPPTAVLGVEGVGQAHGDVLTRYPRYAAARWGPFDLGGGATMLSDETQRSIHIRLR